MDLKPNQRVITFESELQADMVERALDSAGFTFASYILESIDEDFGDSEEE